MIAYIKTDEGISAVINGGAYTITSDNPSFNQVLDAIVAEENPDTIAELFNQANAVKRYTEGNIEVTDYNELLFNGEPIHNVVTERIFEFMAEALPYKPLLAFLNRLMANPSKRSVEELYKFLEHKKMPITEDGYVLGYKGVTNDYKDVHTRKFDNHVGAKNSMPRNNVDDDFRRGCSKGFHVGSLEYATHWGSKTVIVKFDPADVVSVPEECSWQKLRTCKYEVIAEYKGALPDTLADEDDPYGEEEDHRYDY